MVHGVFRPKINNNQFVNGFLGSVRNGKMYLYEGEASLRR